MITVSVHVSCVLDFVSQTIYLHGMFHLSALAFVMSVFLTNMTDRDPVFYTLQFVECYGRVVMSIEFKFWC